MVDFATASNEAEFIESARAVFKAYVPESDAWAQPNFFSINATVVGGLAWSAFNEARNGIDKRVNPQTAVGEYLDIIAAMPPVNLQRLTPTSSSGFVMVNFPSLTFVPLGYELTTAAGIKYTATALTTLTGGIGSVPVVSSGTGSNQNSINNQPLVSSDGVATSLGIFGGQDTESDDQFRDRIFGSRVESVFFGSACSYEAAMRGLPGVTRAWAVEDGIAARILFLMEDKYPCGVPLQADIDAITAHFNDACLTNMFFCPLFEGAKSLTISPEITFANCPDDICEVQDALQEWLRDNFGLCDGVEVCDITQFLKDTFPDYGPTIKCCDDYPPVPFAVYNCVELVGP
jgi:Baseplate J-like protein